MQELVSGADRVRACQHCDFEMICLHNVRDVTRPVRDDVASAVRFGEKRFLKRGVIKMAGNAAVTSTCQWIVAITRIRRTIIDVVARMDAHSESHCAAEDVWQQRATEGRGCRRQRCHRRAGPIRADPCTQECRLRRSVWRCSTHKRRYGRAGPDAGCDLIRQLDSLRPAGAAYHGAHRCAVSDRSSRELYELSDCTRCRRGGADRAGDPLSNLFLPSARCFRRSEYQLSDRPHILVGQLDGTGAHPACRARCHQPDRFFTGTGQSLAGSGAAARGVCIPALDVAPAQTYRNPPLAGKASLRARRLAADRDRDCRSWRRGARNVRADSRRDEYRDLTRDRVLHLRDIAGFRKPHAGGNRRFRRRDTDWTWRRRQGIADRGSTDIPNFVSLPTLCDRAWLVRRPGGVEEHAREALAREPFCASHTGELSLSPTIPTTISVRQRIRTGSVGSL